MQNNKIICIVIVVLVILVTLSLMVNEKFCNCLGQGVKYSSHSPGTYASYGGYQTKYGWPVGMPYDSYARQRMRGDVNNCIPNMEAVRKMTCTPDMFESTYKLYDKPKCSENEDHKVVLGHLAPHHVIKNGAKRVHFADDTELDYGSVRDNNIPMGNPIMRNATDDSQMMMLQSPEKSYKMVYNAARGPGRYGYGSKAGGLTSYSMSGRDSGCGFPVLEGGPQNCSGSAGSFVEKPTSTGDCDDSDGYNLSVGVM